MKRTLYIALFACTLAAIPSMAQPVSHAQERLDKLQSEMHVLPNGWHIVILFENEWLVRVRDYGWDVKYVYTAYTVFDDRTTYVREHWAITSSDMALRHTLAHEAGHIACGCASEDTANQWAREHENNPAWGVVKPGETKTLVFGGN